MALPLNLKTQTLIEAGIYRWPGGGVRGVYFDAGPLKLDGSGNDRRLLDSSHILHALARGHGHPERYNDEPCPTRLFPFMPQPNPNMAIGLLLITNSGEPLDHCHHLSGFYSLLAWLLARSAWVTCCGGGLQPFPHSLGEQASWIIIIIRTQETD